VITVLFRFKGRLVDGFGNVLQDERIFDSNMGDDNPVKIVFSSTPSKKIRQHSRYSQGMVMALDSMRIGTNATAVLPYAQAFDDDGITSASYGYTIVPPYQTVIYDIIVRISNLLPGSKMYNQAIRINTAGWRFRSGGG